jgi:hypothetical protein
LVDYNRVGFLVLLSLVYSSIKCRKRTTGKIKGKNEYKEFRIATAIQYVFLVTLMVAEKEIRIY